MPLLLIFVLLAHWKSGVRENWLLAPAAFLHHEADTQPWWSCGEAEGSWVAKACGLCMEEAGSQTESCEQRL